MSSTRAALRAASITSVVGLALTLSAQPAFAVGEEITDVRVLGNVRTNEATVRDIAGVSVGSTLEMDTLDTVRERLNTVGLFADVNVWWEPAGSGVRINISVKDKFPWAPVPTGSWSANNKAFGLLFVHGNLFGRGKQLVLGGRIANVDSGAVIGYRDPSLFGSWIYWQMQAFIQRGVFPEYDNTNLRLPVAIRETRMLSYAIEPAVGIAWFRRVKTLVAWRLEEFNFDKSDNPMMPEEVLQPATTGGTIGIGKAIMSFDFRAREFAVLKGAALTGMLEVAGPSFGSDFKFWKASASWEHGIKLFKSHNFIYFLGGNLGRDLPFFNESTVGGTNLRGYLYQQFRGDTQLAAKAEYHFPLFSIGPLDFRALGFYDAHAIWFRNAPGMIVGPDASGRTYYQRDTPDLRTYPTTMPIGFTFEDSIRTSVGGGLRFFLRSVAVPLIGFDAGYGIEARTWRFILIVGA
jgi:outer membrane protein insertion porin family